MSKAPKLLHLLALAVSLGSIPGYVLLGRLAGSADSLDGFAILHQAKHTSILALTLPGLILVTASGPALQPTRRELLRARWMRLELGLVLLVVLNGALMLSPIGAEMAALATEAAASGAMPPVLSGLEARASLLGAASVLIALAIVVLAVAQPRLRQPSTSSAVHLV